ncbi:hypothetical protein QN277_022818 [Acacia crassicarpa]|uniref:ER membrane protein complex subunit 4 n=1 Tax=Acacia crassicarpa TaxID=499986 RepID=A0AAE1MMD1_9FABA|nr:hypothetical protein QN277_022818 [Acacia crassicarpa]
MEKGKGVMGGAGRRWAVDFIDHSNSHSFRDSLDPPGFSCASHDQDDSSLSRQKKDAESTRKAQNEGYFPFILVTCENTAKKGTYQCYKIEDGCTCEILNCLQHLASKKAWEVAQAPFKNLLMMGFMMWMAGSTVHLFSIVITFSARWQPISALQGVRKGFEPYKDKKVELLGPKLLYIALNLGGLALGVWKLNTLGLLPTHVSDWVSSLPPAQEVEYPVGGVYLG